MSVIEPYGYYPEEVQAEMMPFRIPSEPWRAWSRPTSLVATDLLIDVLFDNEPYAMKYTQQLITYGYNIDEDIGITRTIVALGILPPFHRLLDTVAAHPVVHQDVGHAYHKILPNEYICDRRASRALSIDGYALIVSYGEHNDQHTIGNASGVSYRVKLYNKHNTCYVRLGHITMTVAQYTHAIYTLMKKQTMDDTTATPAWDAAKPVVPGFLSNRCNELVATGHQRSYQPRPPQQRRFTLLPPTHQIGLMDHKATILSLVTLLSACLKFEVDKHPHGASATWEQRIYTSTDGHRQ